MHGFDSRVFNCRFAGEGLNDVKNVAFLRRICMRRKFEGHVVSLGSGGSGILHSTKAFMNSAICPRFCSKMRR